MTWWQVSTKEKKCVFEHELYRKDDFVIRRVSGFRWGTVLVNTEDDNAPVLESNSGPGADGVDMYNTDYDYELDSLDDGWYEDYIFPDDMPEDERERLLELVNELGAYEALEIEEGWEQYDTECWFHGPLDIVKSDWQMPGDEEWIKADITPELQDHFQRALGNLDDEAPKPQPVWPFPDPKDKDTK